MSQSLVPDVRMSRGNNRKNKFNISSNTHTTAEVGYLQPTFSKILLPNSDLKLKVSDFVRMSSLVVPTFGELSLRHWFNCTPLSSLWACYGSYMSQSQYTDLDDNSGTSVRRFMPMFSLNELFGFMKSSLLNDVNKVSIFYGNLTYALFNGIVPSYSEFRIKLGTNPLTSLMAWNKWGFSLDDNVFYPVRQESVKPSLYYRNRSMFDIANLGIVIKNDDELHDFFTTSNGINNFPTPVDCPYVVMFVSNATGSSLPSTGDRSSAYYNASISFVPLTMRMYQGDTDSFFYKNGWLATRNTLANNKYYHNTGNSNGWFLRSDDSFFTGELTSRSFDITSPMYYTSSVSTLGGMDYGVTLSRRFKRLRKLFIGLGYQFNPFDTQVQTPWKLLHYYKAWFDMFYPKRDTQYYQTPLSRVVNFISYHGKIARPNFLDEWFSNHRFNVSGYDYNLVGDYLDMLFACADAKYILPIDYYTLADPNPQEQEGTDNERIKDNALASVIGSQYASQQGESVDYNAYVNFGDGINVHSYNFTPSNHGARDIVHDPMSSGDNSIDGLTVKLAEKLTTFLTKKRIVGKSISDRMRAIFGAVDPHDKSHESTWCFGTSSTGINISAVMSQSETDEMHLGDYAGQGIGGSSSRTFSVDGNDADIYIVTIMSAIVPKVAYYQGHSRENLVGISPNDFITPLWDAVGYEDVHASEYIADVTYTTDLAKRDMSKINGQIIGLVPRGTWYKVNPHDVLNGDMSLPSVKDSLSPYVLTKDIDPNFSISPIDMRTVDPFSFNKIFNESNDLDDHFIIQMHVEADMYAPLKSISTSYDTFDADEDGTLEVSHS